MYEPERFDAHLEKTNIPGKIEELTATGNALLLASHDTVHPHVDVWQTTVERDHAVWKREADENPQHYIHLAVHAMRDSILIALDNHRPIDHRFPEELIPAKRTAQRRGHYTLTAYELDNRTMPTLFTENRQSGSYPSSPNASDNDAYALRFEKQLAVFDESFSEIVSLLGLGKIAATARQQAQEKRSRAAISANTA